MARWGYEFMQEMQEYVERLEKEGLVHEKSDRYVQLLSYPFFGKPAFVGCPAQFGRNLQGGKPVVGRLAKALPFRACTEILNPEEVQGKVVIVERSGCIFQLKAKLVQEAGGIGVIVMDHEIGSKYHPNRPAFSMASDRDTKDDIAIPAVFVFRQEGQQILSALKKYPNTVVSLSVSPIPSDILADKFLKTGKDIHHSIPTIPHCPKSDGELITVNLDVGEVYFHLRFNGINQDSDPRMHQEIVERHVSEMQKYLTFTEDGQEFKFYEFFRTAAYGALDLNVENEKLIKVLHALSKLRINEMPSSVNIRLPGEITKVRCTPKGEEMACERLGP